MEIGGRDYSILYAERGKERACCYSMEQSGETRYFVLIEDLSQIQLIKGNRIHAFAVLNEKTLYSTIRDRIQEEQNMQKGIGMILPKSGCTT